MPVSTKDLAIWLADLGVDDFQDGAGFTYQGGMNVAVDLAGDETSFLLSAELGPLAATTSTAAYRQILRLSHLGLETGGGALSLADDGEMLVMWRVVDLSSLSPDDLTGFLAAFLDSAKNTQTAIFKSEDTPAVTVEPPSAGAFRV